MLTRRRVLNTGALLGAAAVAPALASCGRAASAAPASPPAVRPARVAIVQADVTRAPADIAMRSVAAAQVRSFTADLHRRLAAPGGNLVSSPYSVAVALAMARNGAGAGSATASQMDEVLHATGLTDLDGGLNALTQLVDATSGQRKNSTGTKTTVTVEVANSLWGQQGERWEKPFLTALSRYFGAGMHTVDYRGDAAGATTAINAWTSGRTRGRIPHLIPDGALDALTRLVLVNAIYLKAPWSTSFDTTLTKSAAFTRVDGSRVRVPMMHADSVLDYRRGPGWQAVRLPYAGSELAMALILPDGPLAGLERTLDGAGLGRMLTGSRQNEVRLTMPTWTTRTAAGLKETLSAMGMPTAFDPARADFSAMTTQDRLSVAAVLHQAWIAVDEQGTEAAAATAVVMTATAGRVMPAPVTMTLDRPFLYVIHEVSTATPLFIGRVGDPGEVAS